MPMKIKQDIIIGWRENISIPTLGVDIIKAKIDTGARTSALHVSNLEIIKKGRYQYAEFVVHPRQKKSNPAITCRHKIIDLRAIKSSNGISSTRPVIEIEIVIGSFRKLIEVTLVNRDLMGFRMLLGRTAIRKSFLVDPSKSFLLSENY